ncbi:MAG TPA: energy transducer TonB [Terriglobales bacterium]|nr:energy transducer TonB [Terriglobales bacterium]
MLHSPTTRKPETTVGSSSDPNRLKKLFAAMVILFATLLVVLVRDTQLWFTSDPPETADTWAGPQASSSSTSSPSNSSASASLPSKPSAFSPAPAAETRNLTKHVAAKHVPEKPVEPPAVVATDRTPLPPLNIEVVSGTRSRSHATPAPVIVTSAVSTPAQVTNVSQREVTSSSLPQSDQTIVAELPLLARQMKVQGSVLLQALIAADGVIRDLRVISGPAILAVAARQAVLQYRFKPYLQNGQPVETSARVTVNFAIRVLGDQTALHLVKGSTSGGY